MFVSKFDYRLPFCCICRYPRPVLKFNEFDEKCNVNRRSYHGPYKVVDGLPL